MITIIWSVTVLGILGILIGLLLGVAGKVFAVDTDERIVQVRESLPGNNCGGCGYAGCDGLAEAIVAGKAELSACPVGGAAVAEKIAEILGVEAGVSEKKVAYVRCAGTCEAAKLQYHYVGEADCQQAAIAPGSGEKACSYGCLGLGSCVKACAFDAIHIENGIAVVDKEKCVACGQCVKACPKDLIELIPYDAAYMVQCHSQDKGKDVMAVCAAGCIGCGICVKQCEYDAVKVENNLAFIDAEKCQACGKCAEKCPRKVIYAQ